MRRIPGILTALAVMLPLSGCGSDSEAISATEFQKRANAICKEGDAELAEKGKKLFGPDGTATPSVEALAAYFTDDALPVARTKLDRIDQIDPPKDDGKKIDRMLAAGRRAVEQVDQELKQDPAGYLSAKGPDPFSDFNELAGDLGLNDCAARQ